MGFDLEQFDAADTATMTVYMGGEPTKWVWLFAGPGHPQTIAISDKVSREHLHRQKMQEQAQVNNKKWKADDETPDEVMNRQAKNIIARMIDWYLVDDDGNRMDEAVSMSGKPFPFNEENALKILCDPRKGSIFIQAAEFFGDERSFTKSFASGSKVSQSENSSSQKPKKV